ncbi:hypothetical protein MTO96_033504 [Rhipicephalus appendiculatus]
MDDADSKEKDGKEDDGVDPFTTQCGVFYCEVCGDTFATAAHVDRHSQIAHKEKREGKHQCSYCPYNSYYKTNVARHERTHTGECPFTCNLCLKVFNRADALEAHVQTHAAEKPFECTECSQHFYSSSKLRRHKKLVHSEDARKHACPYCGKMFAKKAFLQTHLPMHTGKRVYQCSLCPQSFTQLANVRKAPAQGMNAVTVQCVMLFCHVCGDAFQTNADLESHWQASHPSQQERPEGKHRCSYCPYSSDNKSHTTRHERTHTGERPFTCTVCQKGFSRPERLETHMNIHAREKSMELGEYGQYVKPEAQEAALAVSQYAHHPLLRHDVRPGGTTPQVVCFNAHSIAVQEVFPSFRHFKIPQDCTASGTSTHSAATASPAAYWRRMYIRANHSGYSGT